MNTVCFVCCWESRSSNFGLIGPFPNLESALCHELWMSLTRLGMTCFAINTVDIAVNYVLHVFRYTICTLFHFIYLFIYILSVLTCCCSNFICKLHEVFFCGAIFLRWPYTVTGPYYTKTNCRIIYLPKSPTPRLCRRIWAWPCTSNHTKRWETNVFFN